MTKRNLVPRELNEPHVQFRSVFPVTGVWMVRDGKHCCRKPVYFGAVYDELTPEGVWERGCAGFITMHFGSAELLPGDEDDGSGGIFTFEFDNDK